MSAQTAVAAAVRPALDAASFSRLAGSYRPRQAWFERIIACGPAVIKLSVISFDGAKPAAETFAAARQVIAAEAPALEATPHLGAGFAILHRGEEANWLLLLWWTDDGTVTRKLWRGDLDDGVTFAPVDPVYMACVWELGVIDFETRAWIRTAMAGKPLSAYLADTFPRGTV
jgi:hypothetical protein